MKATRVGMTALLCLLLIAALPGCGSGSSASPMPSASLPVQSVIATAAATATPTPMPAHTPTAPPALSVARIEAIPDPEVLSESTEDPYALLGITLMTPESVDRHQYNTLFHAVENLTPKLDVSGFKRNRIAMNNLVASLDTSFRLFYLKGYRVSKNGKTVTFTYAGDRKQILRDTETYHAQLGHLIHDVAPDWYTDLQKLVALYDAVCRMSNYTKDIKDLSTWSPYSIVTHGQGICSGYALLMRYLLNQSGVEADYINTEGHAWNVVKIGGTWYHSDTTWGAGNSGDTMNNLNTLLMDDKARLQGLENNNLLPSNIILGGYNVNKTPPACTDARFNAYGGVGWCYALDLDGQTVYFNGPDGIARMNLDCTDRRTMLPGVYAYQMAFFNGVLYYAGGDDGYLYRLGADGQPELVDGQGPVTYLAMQGGKLMYRQNQGETEASGSIDLLPGAAALAASGDLMQLPGAEMPRGQSFCFRVVFSRPVAEGQNWNELVYLRLKSGEAIPLRFHLSDDGTVLTARPADCLADAGSASLLVASVVKAADGAALEHPCRMTVAIQPGN